MRVRIAVFTSVGAGQSTDPEGQEGEVIALHCRGGV